MKFLLTAMGFLKISDGVMTDYLVRHGSVREGNPLMSGIVTDGNFLLLKIAGALLCVLALWALSRRLPRLSKATTLGVIVFYAAVITWNLGVAAAA